MREQEKVNLAVIYGSVRKHRFCDTVGRWVMARIGRRPEFATDVIDPAVADASGEIADGLALKRRIGWADADAIGSLRSLEGAENAMATLLDRFAWWTRALRGAREAGAYPEAA